VEEMLHAEVVVVEDVEEEVINSFLFENLIYKRARIKKQTNFVWYQKRVISLVREMVC